jgi:hypothetical protein
VPEAGNVSDQSTDNKLGRWMWARSAAATWRGPVSVPAAPEVAWHSECRAGALPTSPGHEETEATKEAGPTGARGVCDERRRLSERS